MKSKKVILDTGPLVAFLNKSDYFHEWAVMQFAQLTPPFFTCEAVISEVCFLLRHTENGAQNTFKLLERELIQIPFHLESETVSILSLLTKYSDVSMSLADACLVRMSEQISGSLICTLDGDFKIYRKDKRKVIPVIIPKST
ncbi:MAG: PIN domain-containing protein [Ignavibacteria bacterium]|jgi:predicted nucleic acid-binding protein